MGSYGRTNSSSVPQGGKGTSVAQQGGGYPPPPPLMAQYPGPPAAGAAFGPPTPYTPQQPTAPTQAQMQQAQAQGAPSQGGKGTSLAQQAGGGAGQLTPGRQSIPQTGFGGLADDIPRPDPNYVPPTAAQRQAFDAAMGGSGTAIATPWTPYTPPTQPYEGPTSPVPAQAQQAQQAQRAPSQGGKGTSLAQQVGGGAPLPPPPMMSGGQGMSGPTPYTPQPSQGGKGTSLAQGGMNQSQLLSALQNMLGMQQQQGPRPRPPIRFKRGGRVRKKVNSVEHALAVTRSKT